MAQSIFEFIAVYPQSPKITKIMWGFTPGMILPAGPYRLELQMSRSGNSEWGTVKFIDPYNVNVGEMTDDSQRAWSVNETWFYRLQLITASNGTFTSPMEPSWGSLSRADRLLVREMQRQECLRLQQKVGSKGILYKRKNWGIEPEYAATALGGTSILDPDTGQILDVLSATGKGTAFNGGYYDPWDYWIELKAGEKKPIKATLDTGTDDSVLVGATGLAFPVVSENDFWKDCTSGKCYLIKEVVVKTKVRNVPVVLDFTLQEIPNTDPIPSIGTGGIEISPGVYVAPTDWSRAGLRWRGIYDPGATYLTGDIVTLSNGNIFICTADGTIGNTPS